MSDCRLPQSGGPSPSVTGWPSHTPRHDVGSARTAVIAPDDRGISRSRRPRSLNVSTLWLQYPSATNTWPEVPTATAVGWQRRVGPQPGRNRSPKVRAGRVSPGRNCNTNGTPQRFRQVPPPLMVPTDGPSTGLPLHTATREALRHHDFTKGALREPQKLWENSLRNYAQ
jgi:hypothetical protein